MIVIVTIDYRKNLDVLAVCSNIKEARTAAREIEAALPYAFFLMIDLDAGCWRDRFGRKGTSRHHDAERLIYAYKSGVWCEGAEAIGMDQPGVTPQWMRTHSEMATLWGDDIYGAFDRAEHDRAVRNALAFGKPVPPDVVAEMTIDHTTGAL